MKQTNNAIKFLMAQYRAIFKNAYFKGLTSAVLLTAGLAVAGGAQAVDYKDIADINALEGDTVTIDNTNPFKTQVYVNGVLLQEDYLSESNNHFNGIGNSIESEVGITEITLKEGYIFYMGDNRMNSADCREYSYLEEPYCEKVSNIVGRVDYIVPHDQVESGDGKDFERFCNGIKEIFCSII